MARRAFGACRECGVPVAKILLCKGASVTVANLPAVIGIVILGCVRVNG